MAFMGLIMGAPPQPPVLERIQIGLGKLSLAKNKTYTVEIGELYIAIYANRVLVTFLTTTSLQPILDWIVKQLPEDA